MSRPAGASAPAPLLEVRFETHIIEWRGPAPFFFAPIPDAHAEAFRQAAKIATYGWGCVPVEAEIGGVVFTTALFPSGETYLLPIKAAVRRETNVTVGDRISTRLTIHPPRRDDRPLG